MTHRDGNALAGDLGEVFAADMTSALFTCAGCGAGGAIATLRVYGRPPGGVGRCPHCDDVVLRVVRARDRVFLEMRGALRVEVALP